MKLLFEEPVIQILTLSSSDVLTASTGMEIAPGEDWELD